MSVILAVSWSPRGELPRLQQLAPFLQGIYHSIAIAVSGHTDGNLLTTLAELPEISFIQAGIQSARHYSLELALKLGGTHIQYCDMDRLVRWAETRPAELQTLVERISDTEVLVVGRTTSAYQTHPDALRLTEALPNGVFSDWIGQQMDFCAGCRGMSRQAAAYVLGRSSRDNALRMDAEWAVLWKRAGFDVNYIECDGLDWESADQFQDVAADTHRQERIAKEYDLDPENWRLRVQVAQDILQFGLAAQRSDLNKVLTLW